MKMLRITACADRSWWYGGLVGQLVPLRREIDEGYLSVEPAGYTNVVKAAEAEIVEVCDHCHKSAIEQLIVSTARPCISMAVYRSESAKEFLIKSTFAL